MSECTHDCGNCSANCGERQNPQSFLEAPHEGTTVHKVIGIVSGKGGVGKSMVTSLLAVLTSRAGYRTAVLDADITGPSIPTVFGLHDRAMGTEDGILPVVTPSGIKVMSLNLLIENETDPVVWRGPVIAGAVKQFWTDVLWGDVDYMFVDMPPGTGDVPLTVFQSLPLDGIVIVTSPQELVSMIVAKAVNMANMMNIPVLGIVENMAYFECPDCGKRHAIFGDSHVQAIAERYGIPNVAQVAIDPKLAELADDGEIENVYGEWLDDLAEAIRG